MPLAPQFLTDQLTLLQPGGQVMPTTLLLAPPNFSHFFALVSKMGQIYKIKKEIY